MDLNITFETNKINGGTVETCDDNTIKSIEKITKVSDEDLIENVSISETIRKFRSIRNVTKFCKDVYNNLADHIEKDNSIEDSLLSLSTYFNDALNDRIESERFCKTIHIGSDYKCEFFYVCIFMNNLKKLGVNLKPGDKIKYIVVKTINEQVTKTRDKIGDKCREYSLWLADENREPIDYTYYFESRLQRHYDALFIKHYGTLINKFKGTDIGYKCKFSKRIFKFFMHPIKMISNLINDYLKLSDEEFRDAMVELYTDEYDISLSKNHYISMIINSFIVEICEKLR